MEIVFPIEFVVDGAPVSLQAKSPRSRNAWKDHVKAASKQVLAEGHWASRDRIAVTLFDFPLDQRQGTWTIL